MARIAFVSICLCSSMVRATNDCQGNDCPVTVNSMLQLKESAQTRLSDVEKVTKPSFTFDAPALTQMNRTGCSYGWSAGCSGFGGNCDSAWVPSMQLCASCSGDGQTITEAMVDAGGEPPLVWCPREEYSTVKSSTFCDENWAETHGAHTYEDSADDCKARCAQSSSCVGITYGTDSGSYALRCVLCTSTSTKYWNHATNIWETYLKTSTSLAQARSTNVEKVTGDDCTAQVIGDFTKLDDWPYEAHNGYLLNRDSSNKEGEVVDDLAACKSKCEQASDCTGLAYKTGAQRCYLYSAPADVYDTQMAVGWGCSYIYTEATTTTTTAYSYTGSYTKVVGKSCGTGDYTNPYACAAYISQGRFSEDDCEALCSADADCDGFVTDWKQCGGKNGGYACDPWCALVKDATCNHFDSNNRDCFQKR